MYSGDIGNRPLALDGCFSTWSETMTDNVVKSEMDSGTVKTRRRFTGTNRRVQATVRMDSALYQDFMDWFVVDQRQGSIPTYVRTPYGAEELFLWMSPPAITWPDRNFFEASVSMWQASGWVD